MPRSSLSTREITRVCADSAPVLRDVEPVASVSVSNSGTVVGNWHREGYDSAIRELYGDFSAGAQRAARDKAAWAKYHAEIGGMVAELNRSRDARREAACAR